MTTIFLRGLFLLVYIQSNIHANAKRIYAMEAAKIKIISNSFYIPAYYKHFIDNISNINSVSKCMYNCLNHEYCRTAVYTSQSLICSLYEEYSFVGSVLPSIQITQSVISFSFCPNSFSEPMYVCYGTPLIPPISIENLIKQLLLTTPAVTLGAGAWTSTWTTKLLLLAPIWAYDTYFTFDVNQNYIQVGQGVPVPGIVVWYMDVDDNNYFSFVDYNTGNLYIRSSLVNITTNPTSMKATCMSDKYVIGTPQFSANQTLYVYWKSNGSQAFLLPAPIHGVVSCLIINETLFIIGNPPDPPIQSIPLYPLLTINNYSVIISTNQCPQAYDPLKIDSSGRLFVSCMNNSAANLLIFTSGGTILGYIPNSFFSDSQLGIKATKYRFSLAASDGVNTYIYDF